MKKTIAIIATLLLCIGALAQDFTGGVKGTVVSRADRSPIPGAAMQLSQGGTVISEWTSGEDGTFLVEDLADGMYIMTVSADGYSDIIVNVTVDKGFVKDLIFVSMSPAKVQDVDEDNFAEFDMQDSGYSDAPTILFDANDVFTNLAGYGFSTVRFKNRGFNSEAQKVMLSGVELNDALTGYSPYSLWTGLNEIARSKDATIGLNSSEFGMGGYNGLTNIFANPSSVRQGLRMSVLTNSATYRLRLMATYASGQKDNGWSYAFSASARLGGNDWIKGVYYRSFAYYAGVEKNWGDVHRVALFSFAAPGERGAQNASTQEVYDLMGDNLYNSNWGYQNGKVRNARVRKTFEPVTVLKYTYTPSNNFQSTTTFLWRTGKNGYTALDWYDAPDPRPDYYRNLPSYAYMDDEDYGKSNANKADWMSESWSKHQSDYLNYQHVNWDRLYNVNYNSTDGRSKYVQEERRVDQNDLNLAETIKWRISDNNLLNAGASLRWNRTENYKILADLLGGKYYVNIDSFAEREYAADESKLQNDLDYYQAHGEAQKLVVGDKYGYDYYAHIRRAKVWANDEFTYGGFSAKLAASVGYESFWREGLVRKGLFPDNSKGNSEKSSFLTYQGKVKLAYAFGKGSRISANAGYFNDAPNFNQAFVSPRTRNTLVPNLTTVKTLAADLNYEYNHKGYLLRVTGFYATIKDQTDVMSFYDDTQNSFTNFAMSGIDQRHLGVEIGAQMPLFVSNLTLSGAFSFGEYIYTSTPYMVQTIDNSDKIIRSEAVTYWASHPEIVDPDAVHQEIREVKHYVPSTPQLAAELALNYNINYWFLEVNGQYFDRAYLDMNPLYRTTFAVAGPDGVATQEEVSYMAAQEKFAPAFLLNLSVGKSWYIHNRQLGFSLQVNNLTNNRNVKTGGYEQTRLLSSSDKSRYYRFDSKYFYMTGINYMLNVYFRF